MNSADKNHCPICGVANQCAVTLGKTIDQCWCLTTDINPQALETIPEHLRGNACICPNCATAAKSKTAPSSTANDTTIPNDTASPHNQPSKEQQ